MEKNPRTIKLDAIDIKIIDLTTEKDLPMMDLAAEIQISHKNLWRRLNNLIDAGILYKVPRGREVIIKPKGDQSLILERLSTRVLRELKSFKMLTLTPNVKDKIKEHIKKAGQEVSLLELDEKFPGLKEPLGLAMYYPNFFDDPDLKISVKWIGKK